MLASKEKDERNVMWHVTLRYRTEQLSQVFVQNRTEQNRTERVSCNKPQ